MKLQDDFCKRGLNDHSKDVTKTRDWKKYPPRPLVVLNVRDVTIKEICTTAHS